MPLPWNVHRICSCASVNKHRAFQHPSYRLPKGTPGIFLLFIIEGKPERADRPAGTTPSEAALVKCWKVSGFSLPNWTRHNHILPTNETLLFVQISQLGLLSWCFDIWSQFSPSAYTFSPPAPQAIPSASCLPASKGWDELQKGMSHIRLVSLNMGIKQLFCNEVASIFQHHEKSGEPIAEQEPGNHLGT